jgi:hypothetical protein
MGLAGLEKEGKILLQELSGLRFTKTRVYEPVPPRQELLDFLLFLWILKELQSRRIEGLRIGLPVGTTKRT